MKATILVCDRCRPPKSPAVATLTLSNGRRGGPQLDLCQPHEAELRKFFTPVAIRQGIKAGQLPYEEAAKLVLEFIKKNGPTRPKQLHHIIRSSGLYKAFALLLKSKSIKKTGTHRSVKYEAI